MRSLPVQTGPLFFSKVSGGIVTMLAPLLAIQVICWLLHTGKGDSTLAMRVLFVEMGLMVALYLWTLALGARMRSEAALGLLSIGILLGSAFGALLSDIPSETLGGIYMRELQQLLVQLLPTGLASLVADLLPPGGTLNGRVFVQGVIVQSVELVAVTLLAYWRMNLPPRVARQRRVSGSPVKSPLISRQAPECRSSGENSGAKARLVVVGYLLIAGVFPRHAWPPRSGGESVTPSTTTLAAPTACP